MIFEATIEQAADIHCEQFWYGISHENDTHLGVLAGFLKTEIKLTVCIYV